MFKVTTSRVNRKLAKLRLHFDYNIKKAKLESWSSRDGKIIYLNPEDRKSRMMAKESQQHILLHELGHIFVIKHKRLKKDPEVIKLFGNLNSPYRRNLSRKYENSDFISHYAQVHPEDNFAEVFAVYANYEGRMKQIEEMLKKNHKSRKVLGQFLWLHKLIKKLK